MIEKLQKNATSVEAHHKINEIVDVINAITESNEHIDEKLEAKES